MPLISAIIPVYNGEKTIQNTIYSVLNQTFSDFELLIINDGSSDRTLNIISSIPDPRLKVFSYPNAGVSASRNRGIFHASGEYITFLDADDLWTPDKLECQLKALQANPESAVAFSWTDYIDEYGQFIGRGTYVSATNDAYEKLLLNNFIENGSNPLICKQALMEVGGFDESLSSCADRELWLRLAVRYPFVTVQYPQILYRTSTNSMSANVLKMEEENLQVLKKTFLQSPKSIQYLKKHSYANLYKYLTFKALEGYPDRVRGLIASRFLWCAARNQPSLVGVRVIWKVVFKIAVAVLLPPSLNQRLFAKFKSVFNIGALMVHIRYEPN